MKMYSGIVLISLLMICRTGVYSQPTEMDSLVQALASAKEDTNKVNILYQLSEICEEADILRYAIPALELAEKLQYRKGIADASTNVGYVYLVRSDFAKALEYGTRSLAIREELGDKKGVAIALNNIGSGYYSQGAVSIALEYFLKSLKIKEEIGDERGAANGFNNVAQIYNSQGDIGKAIEYWQRCLELSNKIDYKFGAANALLGLGHCSQTRGDYASSFAFFDRCLVIRQQINDRAGQVNVLASIGTNYARQGKDQQALTYLNRSLHIAREIDDPSGISVALTNISKVLINQKKYRQAERYSREALQLATRIGEPKTIALASEGLSTIYSATGDYKQAYQMQTLFKKMSDSITNVETRKAVIKKQMQYEFDKKEIATTLEQKKKDALHTERIRQSEIIRNFSIGGAVFILIAGFYLVYRYKEKNKSAKQQALLQERLRISRELHDEVGATLSGIVMHSYLTRENIKSDNAGAIENSLSVMQQSSEEMVKKLNEIVWLVNPEKDSLPKLIQRLEEYARNMAVTKNMKVAVSGAESLPEIGINLERRRNIYLICKEAINNAVKYSVGDLLSLSITKQSAKLTVSVADNGVGFDTSKTCEGNGLVNMHKRAQEIKARLVIASGNNSGTTITLECPME